MKKLLCLLAILLGLTLVGCSTPTAPDTLTVAVTIKDGQVSPNGESVTVAKGGTVTITVTSDQADEVHVHGYDKAIEVTPGQTVQVQFVADQTGVFEVESHELDKLIVKLTVR